MAEFTHFYPTIDEIDVHLNDLLHLLHETDISPENPVVSDATLLFDQLKDLAHIRGGYVLYDLAEVNHKKGQLMIHGTILSPQLKINSYLKEAEQIALFICTAGELFTTESTTYNKAGDYLKGFIIDTLGTLVVEKAMDFIQNKLEEAVLPTGMNISNRYSPGYCDWLVQDQKQLFALLPQNNCQISLTPSCLMLPIKSVSGIIGVGKRIQKKNYSCNQCNHTTCLYRQIKDKKHHH